MAELDIATLIIKNGNSITAQSLATQAGCDLRGLETLLDGLAALGYLAKSGTTSASRYSVPEKYQTLFDSRSPDTCIPMIRHMGNVQRRWAWLSQPVKSGEPMRGKVPASILGESEDRISFIMAMNSIGRRMLGDVMAGLKKADILPASKGARILDVGGASGTYAQAFLEELPEARATIFDLPVGIEAAKKRLAGAPVSDRIDLVTGDFMANDLPKDFDFVWLSAIIHQLGREEARMMYKKAFSALKPGGVIAIRDFVMDEARTKPAIGSLFGINMLVNTPHGRVYTLEEIRQDLQDSGFTDVRLAVDAPNMGTVVAARKPGSLGRPPISSFPCFLDLSLLLLKPGRQRKTCCGRLARWYYLPLLSARLARIVQSSRTAGLQNPDHILLCPIEGNAKTTHFGRKPVPSRFSCR